jgi:cation transport regulator
MSYSNINELPASVRHHLPEHAQEIYREAFNHAWDEYAEPGRRRTGSTREEVAFRVAWAAVKKLYEKDEQTGSWKRK